MSRDVTAKAWALLESGELREAVGMLRRSLLTEPKHLDQRLLLGAALVALGRFDQAAREMRIALEFDPENAAAHALNGEALLRGGDLERAIAAFHRAQRLEPGDETIRALLEEAASAQSGEAPFRGAARNATREVEIATRRYPIERPPDAPADGEGPANKTLRLWADPGGGRRLTKPHDVREAMRAFGQEARNPPDRARVTKTFGIVSADDARPTEEFGAVGEDARPTEQFGAAGEDARATEEFTAVDGDAQPTLRFVATDEDARPTLRFSADEDAPPTRPSRARDED